MRHIILYNILCKLQYYSYNDGKNMKAKIMQGVLIILVQHLSQHHLAMIWTQLFGPIHMSKLTWVNKLNQYPNPNQIKFDQVSKYARNNTP